MTNPHLRALLRRQEKATLKEFHKDGKLGPPNFLIEDDLGNRILVACALNSSKAIDQVGRDSIRQLHAVRYAFCMESWFLLPGEHEGLNLRPSEHPLRHEGIFFNAEDNKGDRITVAYEIKRGPDRKPWLEKLNHEDAGHLVGFFTDMFAVGPYT